MSERPNESTVVRDATVVSPAGGFTGDLRIETLSDASAAQWDRFVASAAGGTFAHLAGWRKIVGGILRHEPLYLIAVDSNGTWRGVLPLYRVRSMFGHYLMSVPFLNDGGPLGDETARRRLVEHAVAEAERSGAALVELRSRSEQPGPVKPTNRKITVILGLPDTIEQLWEKTFKAKLRSQIRRAAKEGMSAKSGANELDAFYGVFARNMRDLGTPVLPRAFFEAIAATFGARVIFTTVRTAAGEPAAAACCLIFGDEVEIVWASSLREFNRFSPNMALYAECMEESIRRGARAFNFGRCTPGGATHKFKLQWGGHDVPLPWPAWSRVEEAAAPSPDRPIFRIATSVWSRLPMTLANRLGPVLSRHLP